MTHDKIGMTFSGAWKLNKFSDSILCFCTNIAVGFGRCLFWIDLESLCAFYAFNFHHCLVIWLYFGMARTPYVRKRETAKELWALFFQNCFPQMLLLKSSPTVSLGIICIFTKNLASSGLSERCDLEICKAVPVSSFNRKPHEFLWICSVRGWSI